MRLTEELRTRLLPIELGEGAYARNRPQDEQQPWPRTGDEVYFRRNEWDLDEDLYRMRVVDVQDPGDQTSEDAHNLHELIRDNWTGEPLQTPLGGLLIVPVADPWPWVYLKWEGKIPDGAEFSWMAIIQKTWESRVRGAPGWLPLDYQKTRKVRWPSELVMPQTVPTPRPATVDYAEPNRRGGQR